MTSLLRRGSLIFALLALLLGSVWMYRQDLGLARRRAPDFASYTDVAQRKAAFFNWLAPVVEDENERIARVRHHLLVLEQRLEAGGTCHGSDRAFLRDLAEQYKVLVTDGQEELALPELLNRVDTVPPRLVLVQAAVESAWGMSRFAREGNNYFGIWTWRGGGMIPNQRAAGKKHTVAVYPDAAASVRTYLYTLDCGASYDHFRTLRAAAQAKGNTPSAHELAGGLASYSERGAEYVAEIRQVLRVNADLLDAALQED